MNTLRDTDEGRARPSVWPVYVMSATILLDSVSSYFWDWVPPLSPMYVAHLEKFEQLLPCANDFALLMQPLVPYALLFGLYGWLGIVAAIGLVQLRYWGWWSAVAWTAGRFLWAIFVGANMPSHCWSISETLLNLALFAMLAWVLATRRQLFFPPKPEGQE